MSLSTDSLFAAARDDAPSDDVREDVWRRVAEAAAAPAAGAIAAKTIAGPMTLKGLVAGALVGAVGVTVVVGVMVLGQGQSPLPVVNHRVPVTVETHSIVGARLEEAPPRGRIEAQAVTASARPVARAAPRLDEGGEDNALALEAHLVTEARKALVDGNPTRALELTQSARRLAKRALEPEESRLEARALRALGRADEAVATELELRRRFPEQALRR